MSLNIRRIRKVTASSFIRQIPLFVLLFVILSLNACSKENKNQASAANQPSPQEQNDTSSPAKLNPQYLRSASLQGELTEVRKAVDQGVDVNAADQRGRTALMLAAFNGHTEVVRLLLEEGARVSDTNSEGRTPLIFAASGPYAETVKLLLEWEADPNVTDSGEGWSALMFAAAGGHLDVVQTLLDYNADPSIKDKDGDMAINFARNNNHQKVVSLLEEVQ